MNLTQAVLVAAATELNEVLGLDPAINLTLSRTNLRNKVREAAELVEPSDELGKETQKVVDEFSKDDKEKSPTTRTTSKANGKDDKDRKSPSDKKTGTTKKEAVAKKEKAYTRAHSLKEVLQNKGGARKDLIEKSDSLYVKHGGKSSKNGAKATVDILLPPLIIFGAVEENEGIYRLTK